MALQEHTTGRTRRLSGIQAGRALAALMVVLYHAILLQTEYAEERSSIALFAFTPETLKAGVDIFFVISGFIMVATTHHKFDQRGEPLRFFVSRISKIFPPYLVLTFLVTLYWLKSPDSVNSQHGGVDLLASYFLLPSRSLPLVPVAWTLVYEMMFYAVFLAFLAFVTRRLLTLALALWATIAMAGFYLVKQSGLDSPWLSTIFSPFVLEFCGGCAVGLAYVLLRKIPAPMTLLWAGIFWFAATQFAYLWFDWPIELPLDARLVIFGPGAVLVVAGLAGSAVLHPPAFTIILGNASYSIYLVHILFLHAAYRLAIPSVSTSLAMMWVVFTAATVGSVIAGLVFYLVIELPLTRLARQALDTVSDKLQPS